MKVSESQWLQIARVVITAALVIAGILGYDTGIVQPREALRLAGSPFGSQAAGNIEQVKSLRVQNNLRSDGTTELNGALTAVGATFSGDVSVSGAFSPVTTTWGISTSAPMTGSILGLSGLLSADGGMDVDDSAFTVADATGNTVISGTLRVTSTTALVGATTATGLVTANGDISTRNLTSTNGISVTRDVLTRYLTATVAVEAPQLSMSSVTFSGPVKFSASSVTDTASIAHGFATTPTACVVSGASGLTATVNTITTTAFSVALPGGATRTVYWVCGK
jgi:hypothetical protein